MIALEATPNKSLDRSHGERVSHHHLVRRSCSVTPWPGQLNRSPPMQMFSEETIRIISSLKYDPAAEAVSCLIPLGSIFWSDELPRLKFHAFTEGVDRETIMRLFAIRINYWNTGEISDQDESLWEGAKTLFPHWPFFRRLHLTEAERLEHDETQRQMENFFTELADGADQFVVSEGPEGFSSFSATFQVDE